MITATEAQPIVSRIHNDPRWFYQHALGARTYDKQIEIVEAVRDHPQVAVCGCNSSGKDWTSGRLMLWWHASHYPAKTVVIGPTHRQVADIVFAEARAAYRNARIPLGGHFHETGRWSIDDSAYAVGFSTENTAAGAMNLQGYHSPHLLVIVTEAHNMSQAHIERARDQLNPERLLLTGNAFSSSGEFFDAFHAKSERYHTVRISAFDTPNVQQDDDVLPGVATRQWVERMRDEWGEESPMYIASVLGQFPDNLEDAIVPRSLLMAAVERTMHGTGPAILSCDVARFGEDKTVVYRVQGGVARQVWKNQGKDTQQIAGRLLAMAEDDAAVRVIVVDDTGVGGGVTDRLNEERGKRPQFTVRCRIVPFNGGAAARDKDRFVNAVAETWWSLAKQFRDGRIDIEEGAALIGQLASRKYEFQGDRRIKLESKDDYKKRVGASPDDADALAMAYTPHLWAPERKRRVSARSPMRIGASI